MEELVPSRGLEKATNGYSVRFRGFRGVKLTRIRTLNNMVALIFLSVAFCNSGKPTMAKMAALIVVSIPN